MAKNDYDSKNSTDNKARNSANKDCISKSNMKNDVSKKDQKNYEKNTTGKAVSDSED